MIKADALSQFSTILDAIRWATSLFQSCRISSPRLNAELLLAQILKTNRIDLYMKFDYILSSGEITHYTVLVDRRARGEPVQYITGQVDFYSLSFIVSPSVLIPRPETELLVDHALACIRQFGHDGPGDASVQLDLFTQNTSLPTRPTGRGIIVDIGTGSGIISLTLAHLHPELSVYATDISAEALHVARHNAQSLGVEVKFLEGDKLEPLECLGLYGAVNMIVSNPPYIPTYEIQGLPEEIRSYEPMTALDGGVDGLDCIRAILSDAPKFLKSGGFLIMEIGAGQGAMVMEAFNRSLAFEATRIFKDYNDLDRIVYAVRTGRS